MAQARKKLPTPVYSTDVYLEAVLTELRELNQLMRRLSERVVSTAKETHDRNIQLDNKRRKDTS